jgi:hypothetical protein
MKILILPLLFYLVFLSIGCTSNQTLNKSEKEKLDPQLQQLLLTDNISDSHYSVSVNQDGVKLYGVIIGAEKVDEILSLGITVNSVHGEMITAKLTTDEIRKIVKLNSVKYVKNTTRSYPK